MGNLCTTSDHDESTTKTVFQLGPDYEELKEEFAGEGIKRTCAWKASISRSQLQRKREEFWKSRTGGRRRTWYTIRAAVETEHQTAASILEASEIRVLEGCISRCKDADGYLYEIPIFVINNPVEFFTKKKKKPKEKPPIEDVISIKIRRAGKAEDCEVTMESGLTVSSLKEQYAENQSLELDKIRLFFGGKEMKDDQTLASYELRSQVVVQAFVR